MKKVIMMLDIVRSSIKNKTEDTMLTLQKNIGLQPGHYISKGIWWSSKKAQGEAAEIVRRMKQLSWEGELKESCMEI